MAKKKWYIAETKSGKGKYGTKAKTDLSNREITTKLSIPQDNEMMQQKSKGGQDFVGVSTIGRSFMSCELQGVARELAKSISLLLGPSCSP